MSKVSGFGKTSASRFPDCVAAMIPSPALMDFKEPPVSDACNRMQRVRLYLATEINVNLCDTARGHSRCRVVAAKLLNELWCEGWILLQFRKLGWVLKEGYNAL